MKKKKVSINIMYNVVNQAVALIVPLVLSPYVARVLSPELIGDYSYVLANSSYFVLVESLGFSLYGMLQVAENRDDKVYVSALLKEIMAAKLVLMAGCIFVYMALFLKASNSNKTLALIMVLNIVSMGIDSTWFLMGMEDFKTTTLRNIAVRIANVLLVLFLVKSEKDFLLYALIMQLSNVISYIVVIPTLNKYIVPAQMSVRHAVEHARKSIVYVIPGLINTIFSSADKTVLGALADSYEVGVYEQASKICTLCGTVINSVSNVLLPRITYLNKNKSVDEAKTLLFKTLQGATIVSIAVAAGIICVAEEFIPFFFGKGYEKSVVLLKILSVNVYMTILSTYIGQQCLISVGRQREYNIAISFGAGLNLFLNILLVRKMQSIGVSFASLAASIIICVFLLYFSRNRIRFRDLVSMSWKSVAASVVMFIATSWVHTGSVGITLTCKILIGAMVYFVMLLLLRESFLMDILKGIKLRR